MPDDLLRPDDVVENVSVVEAEDVMLPGRHEFARSARSEKLVPSSEQDFSLQTNETIKHDGVFSKVKVIPGD